MLWALVVRGINSRANSVTPRSARARAWSGIASGSAMPITVCPACKCGKSARPASGLAPSERTCTRQSAAKASARLSATLAPFSTYWASEKPAASPAPDSITTSMPDLARLGRTAGTRATRRLAGKRFFDDGDDHRPTNWLKVSGTRSAAWATLAAGLSVAGRWLRRARRAAAAAVFPIGRLCQMRGPRGTGCPGGGVRFFDRRTGDRGRIGT